MVTKMAYRIVHIATNRHLIKLNGVMWHSLVMANKGKHSLATTSGLGFIISRKSYAEKILRQLPMGEYGLQEVQL